MSDAQVILETPAPTTPGTQNTEDVNITKRDLVDCGIVTIRGNGIPNTLELYVRHPLLAEVVRKMPRGNYYRVKYDPIYKPLLQDVKDQPDLVTTYPGVYSASKIFEKASDFDFAKAPRGILVMNPDRLAEGFSLTVEIKVPVPPDQLRRFGKALLDGMNDIIAASRPFKMEWITRATDTSSSSAEKKGL